MKKLIVLLLLAVAASGACVRHKPPPRDAVRPLAAEQQAAKNRVEAGGRYDVNHDPNDTMSINSMGSD